MHECHMGVISSYCIYKQNISNQADCKSRSQMESYYEIQRRHARPFEESDSPPFYPLYPPSMAPDLLLLSTLTLPAPAFGSYSPPPLPTSISISASFKDLPTELVLKVFTNLNRVASTCLGLSCRSLYGIHRALHGSVPLVSYVQVNPFFSSEDRPRSPDGEKSRL
jgi:hypothetical protein